jgi:endonuclease III
MPRRPPRPRRAPASSLPAKRRARPTPGSARARAQAEPAGGAHARRGARGAEPARRPRAARPGTRPRATAAARPATRAPRFRPPEPDRVAALRTILARLYPDPRTPLAHRNALELLVATVLSAQCTDERVNQVTPALFERYPDARAFAAADRAELEGMIHSTGFFRNKAQAIQAAAADIVAKFGGEVPRTMDELTTLRGVGRKTANVILGEVFGVPGIVVDTHVTRLAFRLGLTDETDPVRIEAALEPLVPRPQWTSFSLWLIFHGRRVCVARKPRCSVCPLLPHCPRLEVTASE